jgi:hypothetical protein
MGVETAISLDLIQSQITAKPNNPEGHISND